MNIEILILLMAFQAKHLIADYYLQFPYMYLNKGKENGWTEPLADHAGVHAFFTTIIVIVFLVLHRNNYSMAEAVIMLMVTISFDFLTHFFTDRWKAIKKDTPDTTEFWYSLGIDQMIHHVVGIIIVFWITQG